MRWFSGARDSVVDFSHLSLSLLGSELGAAGSDQDSVRQPSPAGHLSLQVPVIASSSCPFRTRLERVSAGAARELLHYPLLGVEAGFVGHEAYII